MPSPEATPAKFPILHSENPGDLVERCFGAATGQAPLNPRLRCTSIGFCRYRGDWLGVAITPCSVDLVLLPGGGDLWGDIPTGQRRYVDLPLGAVAFSAAEDLRLGPYQHAPLLESVATLPDMATAIDLAKKVMAGICVTEIPPEAPYPEEGKHRAALPDTPEAPSRRGFFRRLAGKH